MGDTSVKTSNKQSIVDFQGTDDYFHNVTEPNNLPASCLDHEDADERVKKILVEQVSSDWRRFAHTICLNAFYSIIEEAQNKVNNQLKLNIFLRRIIEINPLNFYEVVANCLYTLKRFDILLCVALDEKFSKVKNFLIENLSTDWKIFAQETHLINIETIVEHIDQDNEDDKSKMTAFLEKLFEYKPLQYKDIIGNALCTLGKYDILFGVALDENDETVKRILIENVSADWKRLARYTCLDDIDSIIKQIDCGYNNDKSKMAAFLNKLYEVVPSTYKKLIVNSLKVASRFDVLFKIALLESSETVIKLLVERASSDWKSFAIYACLHEINCIIENIDQECNSDQMKMKALLEKLFDINPLHFKEMIKSTLVIMKRFNVLSAFEEGCHGKGEEEKKEGKEETNEEPVLVNDIPSVDQVDSESGKTDVSLPVDDNLSESAPLSSFNTGPSKYTTLYDYSAADDNDTILNQEQTESSDLAENKEEEESSEVDFQLYQEQTKSLDKLLVAQVDLKSGKTAVFIPTDHNSSQPAASSSSNTGPPRLAALHDYSTADDDEEKNNVSKDHAKMSDIFDNSELLLQLAIMVGNDWQKLGRFLSVSNSELDVIDADYYDTEEKAHRMFCAWKNQQKFPTLNVLAKAIYSINRKDLISVMEKNSNKSFETENSLKPSIKEKEKMSKALKKHYLKTYGKMDEIVHLVKTPAKVQLLDKFIELTVVDADEVEKDTVSIAERELFLQRQLNYQPIEFKEVFSKELSLLLISGIAGIGKTCLLRKCLLDWARGSLWETVDFEINIAEQDSFLHKQMTYKPIEFYEVFSKELQLLLICGIAGIGKTCLLRKCLLDWANGNLWKNVDLVLYLECRKLNQFQNIGNINELLKVFYEDIFQECNVCEHFSVLFVIDGLDEFAHLDELIKHNPYNPSKLLIVYALAEALNIQKYKCVVAGRVGAISQYKDKVKNCTDKLTIQIIGLNDKGVNEFIEKIGSKKEKVKSVLKESYYAKSMASVPFYLSAMCAIIAASGSFSFSTMTELYCSIFLYFFQNHICKTDETVHFMMQSESNKQHVLRVCKVAWELFNQGKILFSQDEMKGIVCDFDEVENKLLGFIERVESQLGYQYQFAHLTLMEFCASVHAHISLSPKEIICNEKLRSCLPMICGLANENKRCYVRLLANLKNSNEERNSLLNAVLGLLPRSNYTFRGEDEYKMLFMECLFEAQASITGHLKRSIKERMWWVFIGNGKTAHEVSHENYFVKKFFDAGCKLNEIRVDKKILSVDEKNLVILSSTNVRSVWLYHPVKIDGWTPKHKIKCLQINIRDTFVSKNDFEGFIPWIGLAEELTLYLYKDTNFIDDICEWLRASNLKRLEIKYRGKTFYNIEELKVRDTKNI